MQVVKCCIILITFTTFFLFINCSGNTGADLIFNNNKEQENNNFNTLSDDIYLDDQDVSEGSGRGGGEVRDDLEASGSGLGPDDEDGDERELAHYNESSEKKTIDTQKFEESQYKDIETKKSDFIDGLKNNIESSRQPNNLKESEMESSNTSDVTINLQHKGRTSSFFAQPGVLAAIVGGAVVGLLCAILVVMFIVYRMRKKDEGSYALEEPRRSPATNSYPKIGVHANNREFYA